MFEINFRSFRVQYFLVFAGLNLLKLFGVVNQVIGNIGGSLLITTFAWNITKSVRKYFNREFLPTTNKAVLITGADKGLTHELAIKLNEQGFSVYATLEDQKQEIVDSLVNNSRFESKMHVKKMDVTYEEEVNKLAEEINGELQANNEELWAVVNGAEVREFGHFDWSDFKTYEKIFNVNTFGTVRVVRAFLPLIRKSKGRIINIESIGGRLALPKLTAFCMSKHSNIAFADALRRELYDSGIKVSTVELAYDREGPGSESTKFTRSIQEQWEQTSNAVKKFYRSEYIEQLKIERIAEIFQNNLDTAIADLIDAVRGQEPAIRYTPYRSLKARLLSHLAQVLPLEWLDNYYFATEKQRPKPTQVVIEQPIKPSEELSTEPTEENSHLKPETSTETHPDNSSKLSHQRTKIE